MNSGLASSRFSIGNAFIREGNRKEDLLGNTVMLGNAGSSVSDRQPSSQRTAKDAGISKGRASLENQQSSMTNHS